ncbi:cytochrome P450 [Infundibulicybe gibba]|nr:cytochrome P450 [Infundibulicybe gibba]
MPSAGMSTMARFGIFYDLNNLSSLVAIFLGYVLYHTFKFGSRLPKMPPGPPTLPILGNITVFPRSRLHLKFSEWAKVYGDVFSLKVLNKNIIVINTPTLLREVIDKRSSSSSNRPKSILADMITPHNMNMGTGRLANATWKSMRKASAQLLSNENMKRLGRFQHAEAVQLMWELVDTPDNWFAHIRRYTTSFALGIIYGKRGPTLSSPDVADFMDVHPKFLHALEIGTMPPVDLFPILTVVPERWANWKRIVKNVRFLHERLYDRLLATVEDRMRSGNGSGVFLEQAILRADELGLTSRDHIMHLGGVLLEGSDTCSASLQNAVFALTIFPDVLKKAREEIDRVVGADRIPEWEDLPKLPYIMAFIDECNRYRPVGPLGLPHEMTQDEVIDGILYPKGSVIFVNICETLPFPRSSFDNLAIGGMYHDERYYDQPEEFIPERFLKHPLGIKEGVLDDPARRPNLHFGGGRRVCPGIAFAKTSMELNVANFIWGFQFLPALDAKTGKEIYPSLDDYTTGVTATPKPFPIRIVPRSAHHKEVIKAQFSAAAHDLADFELEITDEDRAFNNAYRDAA